MHDFVEEELTCIQLLDLNVLMAVIYVNSIHLCFAHHKKPDTEFR